MSLAPLDPAQDFLVGLGGSLIIALGVRRRGNVGDAPLLAS
jgi:hypothetical protein